MWGLANTVVVSNAEANTRKNHFPKRKNHRAVANLARGNIESHEHAKQTVMLENEIWKDIAGYEGLYEVSSFGRVRSMPRNIPKTRYGQMVPTLYSGKLLSGTNRLGYRAVLLYREKASKHFLIHRLVAVAFIPQVEGKPQINHINGIKDDNRVSNLEWVDASENQLHAIALGLVDHSHMKGANNTGAKLTADDVIQIRSLLQAGKKSNELAAKYRVSTSCIYKIKHGLKWKSL